MPTSSTLFRFNNVEWQLFINVLNGFCQTMFVKLKIYVDRFCIEQSYKTDTLYKKLISKPNRNPNCKLV